MEQEEAAGGGRVGGPVGRAQDAAGTGAGEDQVQPGPSHPEGGEGEGRSFPEEDAVVARQNAHAHQYGTAPPSSCSVSGPSCPQVLPLISTQACQQVLLSLLHTQAQA